MSPGLEALLVVLGYVVVLGLLVTVLLRTVFRAVESPRPRAVARLAVFAGGWLVVVIGLGYLVFGAYPVGTLSALIR